MMIMTTTRVALAVLFVGVGSPLALGQPGPVKVQPPPGVKDLAPLPPEAPQPAFSTLPPQVQKAAREFESRLNGFEVIDVRKRGGAMFYTIHANGPGVRVEMRVIESGAVMTARIMEDDVGEAPPELKAAVMERFGQSTPITATRRTREYYIEPIHWIKTANDETGIVRRTSLNGSMGARYDMMLPGAQPPSDDPLAPMSEAEKAESDAALATLPEAVRAALLARDPEIGRVKALEVAVDSGSAWEISGESPLRQVELVIASGGTVVRSDDQVRAMTMVPPEFADITKQLYPTSVRISSRQRIVYVDEYYGVIKVSGQRQLAMLRKNGKVEYGPDNPLPKPKKPN